MGSSKLILIFNLSLSYPVANNDSLFTLYYSESPLIQKEIKARLT